MKTTKVRCTVFQMRTPTHPTAHLHGKQAVRKWFWSGNTSTEMENEGFTRCEINKNIIATTGGGGGVGGHSKAKVSPTDGVAGRLCGKTGSDGVTSFNQMFVRTYITAPDGDVVWRRSTQNLSASMPSALSQPWLNKRLPVSRRKPVDHWWRSSCKELNLNPRLIRHHIFNPRRGAENLSHSDLLWNMVIQTLCALILSEERRATVDPAGRRSLVFIDNKVCTSFFSVFFFFWCLKYKRQKEK